MLFFSSLIFQEVCQDLSPEGDPFVPTVTAISSTPDFQWMVQPTTITSVSPSLSGKQANEPQSSRQATPKAGGNKGKNAARKGKTEQVGELRRSQPAVGQNNVNLHMPVRNGGAFFEGCCKRFL